MNDILREQLRRSVEIERRSDGAIPQSDLDWARWPTRAQQCSRARARLDNAEARMHERLRQWQNEIAYIRQRCIYPQDRTAALLSARNVHRPHIEYHRNERDRWHAHLVELEAQQ